LRAKGLIGSGPLPAQSRRRPGVPEARTHTPFFMLWAT